MEIYGTNVKDRAALFDFGLDWISNILKEQNVYLKLWTRLKILIIGAPPDVNNVQDRIENATSVRKVFCCILMQLQS